MKPENPHKPIEVCELLCRRYKPNLPKPSCIRSGFCEAYKEAIGFQSAWNEGYNACVQQRISEQEEWQTGEPNEEEGPFLLELSDCFTDESKYRTADWFEPAKINHEAVFITNNRAVFSYIFLKYVKRWKRI